MQTFLLPFARIFLEEYPISTAVSSTSCLVSALISLAPFSPFETVLTAIPSLSAMSFIVAIISPPNIVFKFTMYSINRLICFFNLCMDLILKSGDLHEKSFLLVN